jgi:glutamyl-tRNA reductase
MIVVVGLNHQSAPVEVRERFAINDAQQPELLRKLKSSGFADEAVILSTCNRVELYVVTSLEPTNAFDALKSLIAAGQNSEPPHSALYSFAEPQSVQHLFKVACGLDSMVLGETEILGQLKAAYQLSLQSGHTGSRLNRAFQRAFNVAKEVRTTTQIQRGSVSVGSVAVDLVEKIFSSVCDRSVMVLGAGDTGEKTARALVSRGAKSVLVSNRSFDRAEALAAELGGRAVRFDDWAEEFEHIDIVISSTSAPHYILDRHRLEPIMKSRRDRPLLLIDIAVPRDIDPEVNLMESVYLYNIDDLQAIAEESLARRRLEILRCESIIADRVQALLGHGRQRPAPGISRPAFGHE